MRKTKKKGVAVKLLKKLAGEPLTLGPYRCASSTCALRTKRFLRGYAASSRR
jgi:hypothetical protein